MTPQKDIRRAVVMAVVVLLPFLCGAGLPSEKANPPPGEADVVLGTTDRVLILAPHPDDESIGCGGIIQKAVALGIPVRIAFLTYGDSNEWSFAVYRKRPVLEPKAVRAMGEVRHGEAIEAGRRLGLSEDQMVFLGYPDFGTLDIWYAHWGNRPPLRSMLTRVTEVPYPDALRPGAAYRGEEVLRDLTTLLTDFKPTKVFVSHPYDYNPDHRALWLFTTIAMWDLKDQMQSDVVPYLVHWPKWPSPEGFHPDLAQGPPASLVQGLQWRDHGLDPAAIERKRSAVEAHRTQCGYGEKYLLSFVRSNELFGSAPMIEIPSLEGEPVHMDSDFLHEPHHALSEEERARFVGVERRDLMVHDGHIEFRFRFSRPLEQATSFSLYVFGYRHDRPFGDMPKIHIKVSPIGHEILDQDLRLKDDGIAVKHRALDLSVTIKLTTLGSPEKILTSARTYLGEIPLDSLGWRILESAGNPTPVSPAANPRAP